MNMSPDLNRCLSFINCNLHAPRLPQAGDTDSIKCITISRQSGCGAHVFAGDLAVWLQTHLPGGLTPWTIFNRTLVEEVLRDHNLPSRLATFMPEDRVSQMADIIHDLFNLHPPTETLVRQTTETILRLAEFGKAIIVGRGANIITARLPGVLHVRLVGSLKQRAAHMRTFDGLSEKDALARIEREDGGRRRYLKRYFDRDIDDPLCYHIVINTDWVTLHQAALTVGDMALHHATAIRKLADAEAAAPAESPVAY
jgi:cytidylate kinase